jgi:hypothetical protein
MSGCLARAILEDELAKKRKKIDDGLARDEHMKSVYKTYTQRKKDELAEAEAQATSFAGGDEGTSNTLGPATGLVVGDGIGSEMMKKWGWTEGAAVGKEEKRANDIVHALKRADRLGLGLGGNVEGVESGGGSTDSSSSSSSSSRSIATLPYMGGTVSKATTILAKTIEWYNNSTA